jgi:NAD(P)-dependent dehydrogenase (short-subunit alcohol dehydrogenase family)
LPFSEGGNPLWQIYRELLVSEGQSFPLGRTSEPRDVSELVSYLVSERASWMTGEVILLDGGKGVA